MELCWIKCLAINVFHAIKCCRLVHKGHGRNPRELMRLQSFAYKSTHYPHSYSSSFVPFRCFCYSYVCLFIIASLGRSSVCILQSFKPDWNLSSNEKKSRSKAEWLSHDICRGGAPTLLVVQKQYKELTEKKSQSKEECQSIFTDQESPN